MCTSEHPYLISIAFHIAEGCATVYLAILVMPFLACQYSHLVQSLLKMYTKQSLE